MNIIDVKLQIYRGDTPSDHTDFRVSTGGFIGSPADEHRTIREFRTDDESWLERAKPINAAFDALTAEQPEIFAPIANLLGLSGSGPIRLGIRVYDND